MFSKRRISRCLAHDDLLTALTNPSVGFYMLDSSYYQQYKNALGDFEKQVRNGIELRVVISLLADRFKVIHQQFRAARRAYDTGVFPNDGALMFHRPWYDDRELTQTFNHLKQAVVKCSCGYHQAIVAEELSLNDLEELVCRQGDPILDPWWCSSAMLENRLDGRSVVRVTDDLATNIFGRRFIYSNGVPVRVLTPENMPPYWLLLPRLTGTSAPTLLVTHHKTCTVYGDNLSVITHHPDTGICIHHDGDSYNIDLGTLKKGSLQLYQIVTGGVTETAQVETEPEPMLELGDMVLETTTIF